LGGDSQIDCGGSFAGTALLSLDPQGSLAAWAARREVDDPAVDHLGLERVEQLPKRVVRPVGRRQPD
jgi:hypothetical protein